MIHVFGFFLCHAWPSIYLQWFSYGFGFIDFNLSRLLTLLCLLDFVHVATLMISELSLRPHSRISFGFSSSPSASSLFFGSVLKFCVGWILESKEILALYTNCISKKVNSCCGSTIFKTTKQFWRQRIELHKETQDTKWTRCGMKANNDQLVSEVKLSN